MAKSKKVNRSNPPLAQRPRSVEQMESEARSAGLSVAAPSALPDDSERALRERLQALIDAYQRGKEQVETQERQLREREARLQDARAELEAARSRASAESARLETDRAEIARQSDELEQVRRQLAEREVSIRAREMDADAGFVLRREQMLAKLQEAHQELLDRNQKLHEQAIEREQRHVEYLSELQMESERKLETRRRAFEAELEQRRREAQEGLRARESDLARKGNDLESRESSLRRRELAAQWTREDAEELKAHVEEHIERRTAQRVVEKERELEAAHCDREALRSRMAELETLLREREDAVRALGDQSPEEVRRQIDRFQARIEDLQNQLANRPTLAEAEELRTLREQQATWEQERINLLTEKGRSESLLARRQIEIDAQQLLRDRNVALENNQRLLKAALDELSAQINQRLDQRRDQPAFPEMVRMDGDPTLGQRPPALYPESEGLDLATFAADLRHRIGRDVNGERPPLYYRDQEIRAFLGGMAMSRLHLLQGISGIGKSSLPRAFADAVGGFCETVSVQAGWRDRNDLFGYFNAFEQKYYESSFTQALYRVQTPSWRDRIALILLDEMNLSHPEQYGADVLDVLERKESSMRRFELVQSTPPGQPPALLAEGRYLRLPDNVWFVGTANHDETTRDFAPKTYDRSFVLELPPQPLPFQFEKIERRAPLGCKALVEAFDRACKEHGAKASDALQWMRDYLREPMLERFQIGWGGRLESQTRRFVPVVMAAGGSLGEALDQLVTTRLLRKLRGRHHNVEEDLQHLQDVLEQTWPCKQHRPEMARQLLVDEIRHVRG
jgi:hypothetical protein